MLASSPVPVGYPQVCSFSFPASSVPSDEQIKQDQVSLKNVLASSPRTVWVPRSKVRRVCTGASCLNSSRNGNQRRGGRSSKLDASRQEALARALRGLSAGARRLPRAGLAGLRGAVRRRVSLVRRRRGGGGGVGIV